MFWERKIFSEIFSIQPSPHLIPAKQIAGRVPHLQHSETIDIEPVLTQARPGSEADRVPDCRSPGRVEVVTVGDKEMTKHFPGDPLDLALPQYILVFPSTAGVRSFTRHCYEAAQQIVPPIGDQSLRWHPCRVRREMVGEEPGADSQGGKSAQ